MKIIRPWLCLLWSFTACLLQMRTHSCEQCNRSSKFGGCSSQFSRRGAFLGRACMPRIRRTYRRCRQLLQSRYSSRHLDTWHLVVFWLVCLCFDHQVLVEQNHTARAAALCVELGNALRVKTNTHSCVKKCMNLWTSFRSISVTRRLWVTIRELRIFTQM